MIDLQKLHIGFVKHIEDGCRVVVSKFSAGGVYRDMSPVVFWVLLGTVVLSPLPFGSIYPWSYALMASIVAVLVGLSMMETLFFSREPLPVPISRISGPILLFGAVIVWACIQISPWTPEALHNPVWGETSEILGQNIQGFISVDPHATSTSIMRLLSYAGIFWLALQFGRSSKRAKQVFYVVAVSSLLYASYGIAVELIGAKKILWYDKEFYAGSLTSTFRYKNGYATYAGLGLICTLAMLLRTLSGTNFSVLGSRERAHVLITLLFERVWFLVVGVIAIFSALLLSDSRGGILANLVAGGAFFVALSLARNSVLPYRRSLVGVLAGALIAFLYIGGGTFSDRLVNTGADSRGLIFSKTLEAIAERPVLGWGLGTFEPVFAKFHPPEIATRIVRAHNEYLDNALGLGIPATVALVACFIWLAFICLRGVRIRKRSHYFPAAGFAILILVGLHSVVDFTLQIPAVAATLALLLGTCVAQSWNSINPNG